MANRTSGFAGRELEKADAQGRIAIGRVRAGETYAVERLPNGDILLRPVVVIDKQKAWLFANQDALASVKRGLEQAQAEHTHDLGSFADAANEAEGDEE